MSAGGDRITTRFEALRAEGRAGLVTFVTAGDPDHETAMEILRGLPGAGADIVELGMPFSDPMADGPAIQLSSQRALAAGQNMKRTLAMVEAFRADDADTPVVLMGYYNPIYHYGVEAFLGDALRAGVDGLIVVDVPAEEDDELCLPARKAGLDFIRLVTPATDDVRLKELVANCNGFIYYVSVAGVTGSTSATGDAVADGVGRVRAATKLPVAVGFGIRTPAQAAVVANVADAAVVGSAIVERIAGALDEAMRPRAGLADEVLGFVGELATGVRGARRK